MTALPGSADALLDPARLRVVAAVNQFRIGGTETYLAVLAEALRPHAAVTLVTGELVQSGLEAAFPSRVELPHSTGTARIVCWDEALCELIRTSQPDVVWAQHFDLLGLWASSRAQGIPLLVNFHGPLVGASRPQPPLQALGMALAIHNAEAVTGVSPEVASSVHRLNRGRDVPVVVNSVPFPAHRPQPPQRPFRRFILVARPQKQEHLRQALLVFAAYARRVRGCTLTVVADESTTPSSEGMSSPRASFLNGLRRCVRDFGGRWLADLGARQVLRVLPLVRFESCTRQISLLMSECDVVLGMGRVLLEALALDRVPVLVGYKFPVGVVTGKRFDELQDANFSGRGASPKSPSLVARELLEAAEVPSQAQRHSVDVARVAPQLLALWMDLTRGERSESARNDTLATHILRLARDGSDEAHLLSSVLPQLTEAERLAFCSLLGG